MKEKNMKKAGKVQSVKKLRAITVVCLLVSCLFGAIFITSEQVSASDNTEDKQPNYFNWNLKLPNVYMHAKEYAINQAGTLILPPISGMLIGGAIGFVFGGLPGAAVVGTIGGTIGTAISAAKNMLTFTKRTTDWSSLTTANDKNSLRSLALARAVVAPIGSAISGVKNMLTFTKRTTDWGSLITANDKNSLRNLADWDSLKSTTTIITNSYIDNNIFDFNDNNLPKLDPNVIRKYNTINIPKLDPNAIRKYNTINIPKLDPNAIREFNPIIPKFNPNIISNFEPK